ncbi:hypothetical protein LH447_14185 [Laribacter hongkongensis]|uniref:hypothetical protein n=1 Tax=Laribacter hongkongensis TaxID=168471 RepID=UPI001EFE17CF|nr:hypothetical protein [Laribacter hongkongensis]MCG9054218.1 hypothetical protein [Laribacter hongkongensis]
MTEDMQVQVADQEEFFIESEPANMPPEYKNAVTGRLRGGLTTKIDALDNPVRLTTTNGEKADISRGGPYRGDSCTERDCRAIP